MELVAMIRDAYRFLIPLLMFALLFRLLGFQWAGALFLLLALFVGYFFRNPKRTIPQGEGLVVSPADGKVVRIAPTPPSQGEAGGYAISIFLNVFDVHVNRSPIRGRIETFEYRRGLFKAAYDAGASEVNEQNIICIHQENLRVTVKQIAGLIARRVVCWKKPGEQLERGELFGLIRFGSRVDVLLPEKVTILVKVGDRVKGGSSILGQSS